MPLASDVVSDLAVSHGGCSRPAQLRHTGIDAGRVGQILMTQVRPAQMPVPAFGPTNGHLTHSNDVAVRCDHSGLPQIGQYRSPVTAGTADAVVRRAARSLSK